MTSPLTVPNTEMSQSMNPLGQPNAEAGPSRSPMPPSFSGLPSVQADHNGSAGPMSTNDPQALQARLMAAQQAMLGIQQQQQQLSGQQNGDQGGSNGVGGQNMLNGAALLGNTPGATSEQMLRQVSDERSVLRPAHISCKLCRLHTREWGNNGAQ